jgi:ABC-2 type transport system ATP-binding protein
MTKALKIKNLEKNYGETKVLKGIDIDIEAGDFFALLGHNGAGKTTTINIITDLVKKTDGKVKVFSHDIDTEFSEAKKLI